MITLCICYTIDLHKTADFEQYARRWPEPIKRCGGDLIGYFLPTKFAGPTNVAYALIRFANLTAYEKYREALVKILTRSRMLRRRTRRGASWSKTAAFCKKFRSNG